MEKPPVKVAVIGSGLAGLSAAYYLSKENERRLQEGIGPLFEVHLFEKAASLGMDSVSISVPSNDGKVARVDVPMRSFQEAYYFNVVKLYREIGVGFRPAHFTYSFSTVRDSFGGLKERPQMETTMLYNGRSGLKGVSKPVSSSLSGVGCIPVLTQLAMFAVSTLYLLFNYLRLLLLSVPHRLWAPTRTERLDEWMRRTTPKCWVSRRLGLDESWRKFIGDVVVPLFSCVCTSTMEDVWAMPIEEVLDYIYLGLFTPNYVAAEGVQDVVSRLAASLDPAHIHLSSTITSITPDSVSPSHVAINFVRSSGTEQVPPVANNTINGFSHVIVATQANQAIPILSTYAASLSSKSSARPINDIIQCLGNFDYRRNVVVNHTDDSLAPSDPLDRRILNFICSDARSPLTSSSVCVPTNFAMATHIVHPLPSVFYHPSQTVYQTTNPIYPPSPTSVISVARMERAIVTVQSKVALQDLFCDDTESQRNASNWNWFGLKKRKRKMLGRLQGAGPGSEVGEGPRIWMCGSYAYEGIPLLEGCVASARLVVQEGIAGGIPGPSRSL